MGNYRKKKGDRAEGAVREALRRQGFIVRDGPHNEGGCDLYVFRRDRYLDHEAEVKGRKNGTVNGLLTKEKRSLSRRARECRKLGFPYRLYFVRFDGAKLPDKAEIYTVGDLVASPNRRGLHLTLFEEGLLNLSSLGSPPPMGGGEVPILSAPSPATEEE